MVGSCQTKSREPCLLDTKWRPCPRQAKKMVLMSLTRYEWIPKWWRPAPATNRNLFQWLQANDPTRQRHYLSLTPIGCSGHVAGLQAGTSRTGSISWFTLFSKFVRDAEVGILSWIRKTPTLDCSSKIKMLRRLGFSLTLVLDPHWNLKTCFSTIAILFESRTWLSIFVPRHGDCSGRSLSIRGGYWDPWFLSTHLPTVLEREPTGFGFHCLYALW